MNITVTTEKPESGQLIATLTIAKNDVDAAIAKTYKEFARKYAFQGFRRGRAPRPVIDGIIGRQNVMADATNTVLAEAEPLMIEQLDIVPLGRLDYGEPELVTEKSDYTVEIKIAVAPDVELSSYDVPEINLPPEEVTEAEIERQIDVLRSYRAHYVDVEEKRGATDGDMLLVDVENICNMREYEGDNRMYSIDNPRLHQEFRDGLRGMEVGDEKEIRWEVSAERDGESHQSEFACKVKVNALRVLETPEITEENVNDDYGYASIEELREAVKEEIEAEKKVMLPRLKEDRCVELAGTRLTLEEVPEAYANEVFNEMANQLLQQVQSQGMTLDQYLRGRGITSEEFVSDLHAQADVRARESLALDAIVAHLGIEATEDDVREQFELAGVPDIKQSMDEIMRAGRMPAVREQARRTKAVNWLVENAKVTVVDEAAEDEDAESE